MPRKTRRHVRLKRIASESPDTDNSARGIPPTPETARKLRQDVVIELVRKGVLPPHHQDIALEIRSVHEAVGRGMFARSSSDPMAGSAGHSYGPRDFTQRMSSRERRLWERHYLPWSRDLAVAVIAGLPGTRWLQLVTDIVVDNSDIEAVEARYRLNPGMAVRYLTEALDRYGRQRRRQVDIEPV